ncbi:putative ribonuclease H-like domain-containing protein, partial [Tanacetum coccineum]
PQETNGNTALKKIVNAGQTEEENSSDEKAEDDTVDDDACKKTIQEPLNEYDQSLKNEKITRASSTNYFNTVSTPVNTASASKTFSPIGPSSGPSFVPFGGSFPIDVANLPHDPLMPEISHAFDDESWVEAMQEELFQFKIQKVWTLVDLPSGKKAIGTKWVYRNKKDKRGIVVRNKARLMDVKSAFLYGTIEEEVYICQPLGFVDPEFPEKVNKMEKALNGLHQAPRAWYETLFTYLMDNGFHKRQIDKTFFIKRLKGDILLAQVYVDDIIFGSTKKSLCDEFEQIIHNRFQMSSMGALIFFLGLQVKQKEDGIFISQDKSWSMIGSLMYLISSRPDIMFSCKKQTMVANSTTEAEYIAASHYYGQNPVYHSKTKNIEIRHHFIRDSYEKRLIEMVKIHTDHNVADTKAFDVSRFNFLVASIGKRGRDTKIPQSGGPPIKVGDEAIHKELGDRMERAATTTSSLEVEQESDAQTRFEAASKSLMTYLSQELTHLEVGRTFWETASATTNQNGEMEITATIDGRLKTITESSIRRYLKLEDSAGINSLPNVKMFEQLALMEHVSDSDSLTVDPTP